MAADIYVTNATFSQIGDGNTYSDNNQTGAPANVPWTLADTYILVDDIVLEDTWKSIGGYAVSDRFTGTLDGHYGGTDYSITITSTTSDPFEFTRGSHANDGFGLFGTVNGSTFKNLTINVESDVTIAGSPSSSAFGILCGHLFGDSPTTIDNCIIQSTLTPFPTITGISHVGGMIGSVTNNHLILTNSEVKNIHVIGDLRVGGFIGGITGNVGANKLDVNSCIFNGNVTGNTRIGGFMGQLGTTQDCVFDLIQVHGTINGGTYTGGLLGQTVVMGLSPDIKITNSVSHADIHSVTSVNTANVGGLVGALESAHIETSYATGDIFANAASVGGLVGSANGSTITQSYATGNVASSGVGEQGVGGFVGQINASTISESYSTGSVTGQYSGGFVGRIVEGTIENCYSTGHVTGFVSGGFVGKILDAGSTTVKYCYSTGEVTGSSAMDFPVIGGFIGSVGASRTSSAANVDVLIMDSMSFGNYVLGRSNAGKFIGGVLFDEVLSIRDHTVTPLVSTMDVEIQDSYYWDSAYLRGSYVEPTDYSITTPITFDGTASVSTSDISKDAVWFTYDPSSQPAIWTTWSDTIWEESPSATYGLPILKWQISANAPIPDGTNLFKVCTPPSSGGSGTGSATISNNGSTQSAPVETNQPVTTPTPQTNNSTENNNTTLQSPAPTTPVETPDKSNSSIWLIIGGILLIAVVVGVIFGVKYYRK